MSEFPIARVFIVIYLDVIAVLFLLEVLLEVLLAYFSVINAICILGSSCATLALEATLT